MINPIIPVLYWLSKPFHKLNKNPVIARVKNIHFVKFGLYAALDALSITIGTTFYLFIKGFQINISQFILLPLFIWFFSRLFHLVALGKKFFKAPAKYLAQTGFYVHGGLIGAVIWVVFAVDKNQIYLPLLLDGFFWSAALGQFFGRLGCYNYGCCYGRETCHHGIIYSNPRSKVIRLHPELKDKPIHPSQLYTALLNLIMFLAGIVIIKISPKPGILASLILIYHAFVRISIESIRGDIFFHSHRNKITLMTSVLIGLSGIILFPLLNPESVPTLGPLFTLTGFIDYLIYTPQLPLTSLIICLIVFSGFGVHGKYLGYFPLIRLKKNKGVNK